MSLPFKASNGWKFVPADMRPEPDFHIVDPQGNYRLLSNADRAMIVAILEYAVSIGVVTEPGAEKSA